MIRLNGKGWVVKNYRRRNNCESAEAKEKLTTYLNVWTLSRGQSSVAREDVQTSGKRPYLLYRIL